MPERLLHIAPIYINWGELESLLDRGGLHFYGVISDCWPVHMEDTMMSELAPWITERSEFRRYVVGGEGMNGHILQVLAVVN